MTISNSSAGALSGLSVGAITYGAGGSGWAAATVSSTTAPATLTITASLGALAAGSYTATVPIISAGASNSPQNVPVTFTVSAAGGISFGTDIYTVFQSSCATSGCHVPGKQKPDLSTKAAAYTNLVTATTKYVTPGNQWTADAAERNSWHNLHQQGEELDSGRRTQQLTTKPRRRAGRYW